MSSMPRLGIFLQKFTIALSYRLGAFPIHVMLSVMLIVEDPTVTI